MDIWSSLLDILGTIGGIGAVIVAVSAWLGKLWAAKILQKEVNKHDIVMKQLSAELQKEIDRSKLQLDILKESAVRYSEFQFKLYNELWGELYFLKVISDELWQGGDQQKMRSLVQELAIQMEKTTDQIKKNALLIEEEHIAILLALLDDFRNYELGKMSLIEMRNNLPKGEPYINYMDISSLIQKNEEFKQKYSEILQKLEKDFRQQLQNYHINALESEERVAAGSK